VPTNYKIRPELNLVLTRAHGVLTEEESWLHYEKLKNDPAFRPSFGQLCDLTDVTDLQASPAFLRRLATLAVFSPQARRAFVAPRPAHYGLARMLQAFSEFEGSVVGVFASIEEAEAWLEVPPDRTGPAPPSGP
jgi:hypothetical protein